MSASSGRGRREISSPTIRRRSRTGWAMGVRAAIGTCREGLAGMADSHDEARVARRVAELRAVRPGTVVGYRAADLTALLTADPVEAVRFAEAELGELIGGHRRGRPAQGDGPGLPRGEPQPGACRSPPRDPSEHRRVPGQAHRGAARTCGRAAALALEVALRLSDMIDGLRAAADGRRRARAVAAPRSSAGR